ncbi:hypothetical protein KUTeg_006305 [Tegillarca granosa]|uniref:AIG1-type G domain-containing protein n=1 Tax=Tegillarca granosa TaxID=220873 RepID=A0ABQ9FI10_TEGGR|nr:hypothetical protein KUTeg_006305 [Tegillarca granosa]
MIIKTSLIAGYLVEEGNVKKLSSEQQISDLTVTSQEEKHKYLSDIPSKQQKNQDCQCKHNYGIESNEIRMIAIGKTGAGKSATANTIVGRNVFESKAQATSLTTKCKMEICNRFDRKFVYIDTPGIFDPRKTNEQVISEIAKCIGMTVPGPHVFLYVVSTLGTFTKEDQDAVQFFEDHFGTGVYKYLIVVFTRIDELDNDGISIDEFVKNVPGKLKEILRLCDNRYVGFNNRLKGEESHLQVQLLLDKINSIIILNDNQCFTNAIYNDVEEIMRKRLDEIKNELEEKKKRDEEALRKTMSKQFEKEVIKSKEKRIKMKIKKLQLESQYILTKVKAVKSEISDLQKQLQYSMERSDIQSEKKIIEKIQNMVMKLLQLEMQIKKQLQMKRKKEEEELDRKTKQLEEEAKDKTEKQMLEKKLKQLEEEKIENARKQKEEKEELARIAKLEKEMLEAELEFLETARCLLEEQLERERKLEEKHKEELNRVRDKTRKEVEEVNTCNFTIRNRTVPYWVEYLRGY